MPSSTRSIKSGATANDRRLIAAITAANGAPTTSGQQMFNLGIFEDIDIVAVCTGAGSSFDIQPWYWYEAAQVWVADAVIGAVAVTTAAGPSAFPLLNNPRLVSADGVYLQVLNVVNGGAGVTCSAWAQGRFAQ